MVSQRRLEGVGFIMRLKEIAAIKCNRSLISLIFPKTHKKMWENGKLYSEKGVFHQEILQHNSNERSNICN